MPAFSATRWTLIRLAQDGDPAALSAFVGRFREPVVRWLARSGAGEEAEDLAQEVFLRFVRDGVLARAEPGRGRLRSLVFAVSRNVLGDHRRHREAAKRGGGRVEPLGDREPPAAEEEADFDREWLLALLEQALARLEQEHPNYHAAVVAGNAGRPHADLARELGCTAKDVTNWVHRGKQRLSRYVREAVWEYSTSERECVDELAQLSRCRR